MEVRRLSATPHGMSTDGKAKTPRRHLSTRSNRRKRSDSENDMFTHEEFLSILEKRDKLYEEFDKKPGCSENDKRCDGSDSDLDIFNDTIWDVITPENSPKLQKPRRRSPSNHCDRTSRSALKELPEALAAPRETHKKIVGSPSDPIGLTLSDDSATEAEDSLAPSFLNRKPSCASNDTPKRINCPLTGPAKTDGLPSGKRVPQYIAVRSHCLDENGFPLTQPALANLLEGVIAYVDVRSGADNRSSGLRNQLHKLGAQTVLRYSNKVTHLLYNNGSQAVLRKAHERGIHIVSVLWIDACLRTGEWADEKLYKPFDLDKLLSPTAPKLRRVRNMQPKSLEEDMAASERRMKRRQKREEKKLLKSASVATDRAELPQEVKTETFMDKIILRQVANWTPADKCKNEDDDSDDSYLEMKCTTPLAVRALMRINSPWIAARRAQLGMTSTSTLADSLSKSPSSPSIILSTAKEDSTSLKRKHSLDSEAKKDDEDAKESDTVGSVPQAKRACVKRVGKKLFPNKLAAAVVEEVIVAVTPDEPNFHKKVHVSAEVETPISIKPLTSSQTHKTRLNASTGKDGQEKTSSLLTQTAHASSLSHGRQISQENVSTDSSSTIQESEPKSSREETKIDNMTYKMESKSRKSLEDFVLPKQSKRRKQRRITNYFTNSPKSEETKLSTIVCTSLSLQEYNEFCAVVKKLGGFQIKDKADRTTTHVVCGNSRRTLNIVHGLVQGAWLLTFSWVKASSEAGQWVPETSFELQDYPVVKEYRELKVRGDLVALFAKVGWIYVSPQSRVPQKDVISLIESGGGFVTKLERAAHIVLGEVQVNEKHTNKTTIYADSKWVLDCIVNNKILAFDSYVLF